MYPKFFLIFLFTAFLVVSCSSCKIDKDDQNKMSLEKSNGDKMPLVGNPALPPGTVKVNSLISSITDDDTNIITITIEKILGRGSSAPVISSGQSVSIKLNSEQREKILSFPNHVDLIIKPLPSGRGMEGTNINIWQLISIE